MPRPKNTIPSVVKNLSIPQPLVDRVDLILYSPLEGKVPFGAWSEFVTSAIKEKLDNALRATVQGRMKK